MKFLLPVLIPVAFVAFWCAICFGLAAASGWRTLAQRFRASHTPHGQKFGMQGAIINATRFNGALTFIVSPEGLYLKVMPLFSVFGSAMPPLLLPWSELSPLQRRSNGRWLKYETWTISVALAGSARVEVTLQNRALAQAIASFQPGIQA